MKARVYRYMYAVTASILYATCVAEIELYDPDEDQDNLAAAYEGDFIILEDDESDELYDKPDI
jgi:hypothetical protein